jgi:hypothetical protein
MRLSAPPPPFPPGRPSFCRYARIGVTIGFAAGSGAAAFQAGGAATLSVFTLALVTALDSQGHVLDVVPLLEAVRASVCAFTRGVQTPCVYSAKAAPVRLVSLVGTVNLGTRVSVNDVMLPLVGAVETQVCNTRCSLSVPRTIAQVNLTSRVCVLFSRRVPLHCLQIAAHRSELFYYYVAEAVGLC